MINNLWIVITTVNKPTKAIINYSIIAARMGWRLLIVGDVKTPNDYDDLDCVFLSIDAQMKFCEKFSNLVPLKHYSRKNIGYLYAIENGAEWIFDTDDDNIPLDSFVESIVSTRSAKLVSHDGFVNVYKYFSHESVWPRGLPLPEIQQSGAIIGETPEQYFSVTQFLADKDPDVDAIYRLTNNREILFSNDASPIYLTPGTWSPFNSQATLFQRKYFRSLYLPCHVPFRMTDIWRSFVAQKILWADGGGVAFIRPNVVQLRNPHNYFMDFQDEILGYLHNQEICRRLELMSGDCSTFSKILVNCYSQMQAIGIVDPKEFCIIEEWNSFLDRLGVL